ncbi:MAG: PAS domain S-box protein [Halobacteriota archaeon]|nr:PAS domain S-box protein [Halobacteriota archaeon]
MIAIGDGSNIALLIEGGGGGNSLHREWDIAKKYLDPTGAILVAIDLNQNVAFVNEKCCEVLGYKEEEVIGKNWFDTFIPKKARNGAKKYFQKLLDYESSRDFENIISTKESQERLIVWQNSVVVSEEDIALGVIFSGEDLTEKRRMEEELKKTDEIYSKVVERANDAIFIVQDGVFKFANQKMADFSKYMVEELVGMDFQKLITPESVDMVAERVKKRFAGEHVTNFYEIELLDKEGHELPIEVNAGLIEYEGRPADLVFLRDISERKKIKYSLREYEQKYSTVVEKGNDGIIIIKSLKVLFYNKRLSDMIGLTYEEAESIFKRPTGIYKIINKKHLGKALDRYRRRMAGEEVPQNLELEVIHKDGHTIPVELSSTKIEYENGPADLIFIRDITERKKIEVEKEELLEDLERSNKELEQFAYVASHDLQEPLRMVSSYMQLLSRRYKGKLDSDADEFIHFAVDGATRMQRMINDLLTYSRVGTRGRPFEETDCEAVIGSALINLEVRVEESGAVVTHDPLPTIMADDVQFVQLLQNLISNAVKYNDKETPTVHLRAEERDGEWLFSVKDNGIGIDPEYKDQVFQIFRRLQTKEEYEGSGIGLSVCRKIVERHGGRIWLESKSGEGTTFYFTIPSMKVPVVVEGEKDG